MGGHRLGFEAVAVGIVAFALLMGCDSEDPGVPESFELLDGAVCDAANGRFTREVDHPYFPLAVGSEWVLEGVEDGTPIRIEITVLERTEVVSGVVTRVVESVEFEGGALVEISNNYFVQAEDGTVCYWGEEVDNYEDGVVVDNEGSWRADEPGHAGGILMPGDVRPRVRFFQERAPGIAEDMSAILDVELEVQLPIGELEEVVWARDWNPLEGQSSADGDDKWFAPGFGLVADGAALRVE